MALAIALQLSQIAAALRLHKRVEQWQLSDKALTALREQFPGFEPHEVLLKATVINALFGTNVYAIERVAKHVAQVMAQAEIRAAGPELVERLANPPPIRGKKKSRNHSFAAKFAHFFVDGERFPIMDSYATQMLELHLGEDHYLSDPERPYVAFCRNLDLLKKEADFTGSYRELDHYLWLAGAYLSWKENGRANAEARLLFENPAPDVAADLNALVPPTLAKAFRGKL